MLTLEVVGRAQFILMSDGVFLEEKEGKEDSKGRGLSILAGRTQINHVC